MILEAICALVTISLFLWYFGYARDQQKYGHIPGPNKLPILGNMLQLNQKDNTGKEVPFQQQVTNLAEKYGDVMWINVGLTNIVVLSSYKAIYEALIKKGAVFADRHVTYRGEVGELPKMMFGMNYNPKYKILRTTTHKALRIFGETTDNLEKVVHQSLDDLVEKLNGLAGQHILVPVAETLMEVFANTINILIFGKQFDPAKATFSTLANYCTLMSDSFETNLQGMLVDKYPILRFIFRQHIPKIKKVNLIIRQFWLEQIQEHKENWNGEKENCLMDILIKEQRKLTQAGPEVQLTDDNLLLTIHNMFIAGFMTSASVMSAVILLCLHNPEIEQKIYYEVCSVVGSTGYVSVKHKHQLHYTIAVLFEVMRYISLVSLGGNLFHQTSKDTSIKTYTIPEKTPISLNQWALHHDPQIWTDPWSFIPERFLNSDGTLVAPDHPNRKRLLPFGAGERVCVAEVFAVNRLCIFLTSLVQRYHFKADDSIELPSPDPRKWLFSFFIQVPPFKIQFVPRD